MKARLFSIEIEDKNIKLGIEVKIPLNSENVENVKRCLDREVLIDTLIGDYL